MSVTATTNKVQYAGAGTTGPFAFNYPVRDQSELDVYVTVDATGVPTLQTITTHYTVSVNDDFSGASVTFVSSVAAGNTVTINRNPALTNENTYNIYDGTFPTVIEEDIDRTSMQDQFLQEQITRSLKAQISDDLDATLPPLVGNDGKYIELVDDGDGTFSLTLSSSTVTDGVTNAGTSTDNAVARFDGTTGEIIQDSGVIIDDSDNVTGVTSIDIGGTIAVTGVLDEDTMSSDSAVKLATQQSIKAYVDTQVAASGDVVGPASATDNAIARFNNSGKIIQDTSTATISDGGELTLAQGITAGGGTFDASLSAWDLADSIKYTNNTDYARFIAYGDSSGTGTSAASAFVCIDENKGANERVLFFGMGGSNFTYHGGISAGNNAGTTRTLIGFDLDSAGADVIYMHEDLVCEAGVSVTAGDLTMTSGNVAIAQGAYMRFQGNTASREEIDSHVAGVLNISSRAGTHFYMDTDNNAAANVKQVIFYSNATRAAGTATEVASLTDGGAFSCTGNINTSGIFSVDSTQVVSNRVTGWGAPSGTATRTTFDTTTVTTEQLAERVHALIDDLTTHGLIGA